jgi:hypothetical protein
VVGASVEAESRIDAVAQFDQEAAVGVCRLPFFCGKRENLFMVGASVGAATGIDASIGVSALGLCTTALVDDASINHQTSDATG